MLNLMFLSEPGALTVKLCHHTFEVSQRQCFQNTAVSCISKVLGFTTVILIALCCVRVCWVILFCGVWHYTQHVRIKIAGNGQTNMSIGNWKIRHLWLYYYIHCAVLPIYYLIPSFKVTEEIKHNVGDIHTPYSLMENRHWVLYK